MQDISTRSLELGPSDSSSQHLNRHKTVIGDRVGEEGIRDDLSLVCTRACTHTHALCTGTPLTCSVSHWPCHTEWRHTHTTRTRKIIYATRYPHQSYTHPICVLCVSEPLSSTHTTTPIHQPQPPLLSRHILVHTVMSRGHMHRHTCIHTDPFTQPHATIGTKMHTQPLAATSSHLSANHWQWLPFP